MAYTRKDALDNLTAALSSGFEKVYKAACINWKGKTTDTREYYSELFSTELLTHLLAKKIPAISRSSSYKTTSHFPIQITDESNREEENFAKRLCGLHIDKLGQIIDYQIPLKDVQKDGAGKIDLISFNKKDNTLYLIELKYKNNEETLLRASLEIFTYFHTVDQVKLKADYGFTSSEIKVKPAVLLVTNCNAYNELNDVNMGTRPKLKALALLMEISYFTLELYADEFVL